VRALNETGVGKIRNFQRISHRISERCKTGPKLLLMTNRKSHTPFRLVPNQRPWTTLNGWLMPSVAEKMRLSEFTVHHKNLNEDRPILSAEKCRQMTLVSGGVTLMRISAEVPREAASNHSGVIEKGNF